MKYIVTEDQLQVLLAVHRVETLYCFTLTPPPDDRLVDALHQLYRQKLLVNQDAGLKAADAVARILDQMQGAKRVVRTHFAEGEFPDAILYPGVEEVAVLECRQTDFENSFALHHCTADRWVEELTENDLPVLLPLSSTAEEEESICLDEGRLAQMSQSAEELFRMESIDTRTQSILARICLLRWQANYWLMQEANNKKTAVVYSAPMIKALLRRELGEEKL